VLLERFLDAQDEVAFAALVRRHERLVQSARAKVLTDANDIDDAFQTTCLVLVRKEKSVKWQSLNATPRRIILGIPFAQCFPDRSSLAKGA